MAQKYECEEFLVGDPSWFMHQIEGDVNRELLAFVSSALSYGSRRQFLPKIQVLLDSIRACGTDSDAVSRWLLTGRYASVVPLSDECFYRLYTCRVFHHFLSALAEMVSAHGSIRGYLVSCMPDGLTRMPAIDAIRYITRWFVEHGSTGVIPKDTTSSCKRVCMFLRWMGILVGGLLALAVLFLIGLNSDAGRRFVVTQIEKMEFENGMKIAKRAKVSPTTIFLSLNFAKRKERRTQ